MATLARLSTGGDDLTAPRLLREEVAHALLTGIRRRRWSGAEADRAYQRLPDLPHTSQQPRVGHACGDVEGFSGETASLVDLVGVDMGHGQVGEDPAARLAESRRSGHERLLQGRQGHIREPEI